MSQRRREWLETLVLDLPPPAVSCSFICFPARSPQLQRGGVTGTWKHVLSLGPSQSAQMKNFGPRLPAAVRTVPCCEEGSWKPKRTSGGRWAGGQPLGTGPEIAWAGAPPRLVLVYKCETVSMSHIPGQKLFPRIWTSGAHWSLLRAGLLQ